MKPCGAIVPVALQATYLASTGSAFQVEAMALEMAAGMVFQCVV